MCCFSRRYYRSHRQRLEAGILFHQHFRYQGQLLYRSVSTPRHDKGKIKCWRRL